MAGRGRPRKVVSTGEASASPVDASITDQDDPSACLDDLPAYQRENPEKLTGEALRNLAHRSGIARSELSRLTEDQIRAQMKFIEYRRAHDDAMV